MSGFYKWISISTLKQIQWISQINSYPQTNSACTNISNDKINKYIKFQGLQFIHKMSLKEQRVYCESVGYRNAKYIGQTAHYSSNNKLPQGYGVLLDDMFLLCMSSWKSSPSGSCPSGPSLLIYPTRQIFYTSNYPENGKLQGVWSFTPCGQNFTIFGRSQQRILAIINNNFPQNQTVTKITIGNQNLQINKQYNCKTSTELWECVSAILQVTVPKNYQTLNSFFKSEFEDEMKMKRESQGINLEFICNSSRYGLVNGVKGIGFEIDSKGQIKSMGEYENWNGSMHFGRKYLNETKIQEGIFSKEEVIYAYNSKEKRPAQSYKTSQNYFMQSTQFCNRFLHLSAADEVYKKLSILSKDYIFMMGRKYGQQVIENIENGNNKNLILPTKQYQISEAKAIIEREIQNYKRRAMQSDRVTFDNLYQNQSAKRRSRSKSIENTMRRSPRSSPRKYVYTDEMGDFIKSPQRTNTNYQQRTIYHQRNNHQRNFKKTAEFSDPRTRQFNQYEAMNQLQMQLLRQNENQRVQAQKQAWLQLQQIINREKFLHQKILSSFTDAPNMERERVERIPNMDRVERIPHIAARIPHIAALKESPLNIYENATYNLANEKFIRKHYRNNYTYIEESNLNLRNARNISPLKTPHPENKGRNFNRSTSNIKNLSTKKTYRYID